MSATDTFRPNWAVPPGETVLAVLKRRSISKNSLAKKLNCPLEKIDGIISGVEPITSNLAKELSQSLGSSPDFWLNRELQYREDIQWVQSTGQDKENISWLKEIPAKDMVDFGWIKKSESKSELAKACLEFFNVNNPVEWFNGYRGTLSLVAFRTSATFSQEPAAIAAWLQRGKNMGNQINCKPWDQKKLRRSLLEIRKLTRQKNPEIFLPELQKICAECGVAVVVARAPKGCRASGATRFLSDTKALIMLSFRYKSDDHFWFTFFHETAHLLLHGKNSLFLEGKMTVTDKEEIEANEFSSKILIPAEFEQDIDKLDTRDFRKVMRLAKKIGISPGILVGQLQFRGLVAKEKLNYLKTRYSW